MDAHFARGRYGALVFCLLVVLVSALNSQVNPGAQVFRPSSFQSGSRTGGIQEAIDAAAKAGGGTVQIPAGTFLLHAAAGRPAVLLRSGVRVVGAGPNNTILRLEPRAKVYQAVMANQSYANPDAAEPDHDIALEGFTIDVAAADQVLGDTRLRRSIPLAGEQDVALESGSGVRVDSLLLVDPGPNEEIVPVLRVSSGTFRAFFMRPHPEGVKVVQLVDRVHGLALVGAHNVNVEGLTIQNANMDGIYLTSTVDGNPHQTYCKKINIQHCSFIACHRNGISVIDAEQLTIAGNKFQEIIGDPGAPVDVEPNNPQEHGSAILITGNNVYRCYRGISLSLQFSGPKSENFRDETVTGNNINGMLYGWGIYVLWQQAGAVISENTISGAAGDGILLVGSSGVQVKNNVVVNPGRCHTTGNCPPKPAIAAGIRILDGISGSRLYSKNVVAGDIVTGNKITDNQQPPTMQYGIDFPSDGTGNTIEGNVASGFDSKRGMVVHVAGKGRSNVISRNTTQ